MYTPGLTDLGTYPGGILRDWYQLNPSEPIGPFRDCFSPASDFRNDLKRLLAGEGKADSRYQDYALKRLEAREGCKGE